MTTNPWALSVIVAMAAIGCASAPRPDARLASSEGAVRSAEELGAKDVPAAALHLELAREERATGVALVDDGKNHQGELFLISAEADAELAVALTRENTAKLEAEKARIELGKIQKKAPQ